MLTELLSSLILLVFTGLLLVGAISTGSRWIRYRKTGFRRPRLLNRDVVLVTGLSIPFVLIAASRAFGLQPLVAGEDGPHLWWLLLTGIPPIIAIAVYDYFELRVIERDQQDAPPPQ